MAWRPASCPGGWCADRRRRRRFWRPNSVRHSIRPASLTVSSGMTDVSSHVFASEGAILRGKLYAPADKASAPVVVLAHGFSAVAAQLEPQARAFAAAGFAAFVYDNPGFGLSGGYPRQEVDPVRQVRGYPDAVSYVRTLADVDPQRIAIWGSS